jgi:hypothetical protein
VIVSIERNIYQGKMLYKFYKPYDLIVDINKASDSLYKEMLRIIDSNEIEQSKFQFDSFHVLLEIRQMKLDSLTFAYKFDSLNESLGGDE